MLIELLEVFVVPVDRIVAQVPTTACVADGMYHSCFELFVHRVSIVEVGCSSVG